MLFILAEVVGGYSVRHCFDDIPQLAVFEKCCGAAYWALLHNSAVCEAPIAAC
jgi:hypothetical protein